MEDIITVSSEGEISGAAIGDRLTIRDRYTLAALNGGYFKDFPDDPIYVAQAVAEFVDRLMAAREES